jgi:hypothetical protein
VKVRRYDVGRLGQVERTPQGGVRVPAYLTRTGVFEYVQDDGSIRRELRSKAEVFAPAAMQSLIDAPITDFHPETGVNAANYRELSVGHISGAPAPAADEQFVSAVMVIQDANEVALIDAGERVENSCGYDAWLDMTSGVDPEHGEYDAEQKNIIYNHVALLPKGWGRAGGDVALRLDSKSAPVIRLDSTGNALPPGSRNGATMKKTSKKDGDEAPAVEEKPAADAGTCPHCGAPVGDDGKFAAPAVDADPPVPAKKEPPAVDAKTDAKDSVRMRVGLERIAVKAGIAEDRLDSMSDDQVRRAVVGKVFPDHKLDGKSEGELAGLFGLARERVSTKPLEEALGGHTSTPGHADSGGSLLSNFAISQTEAARKKGGR